MANSTHNSRLLKVMDDTSAALEAVTTQGELLAAIKSLRDFQGPLKFDNATLWTIAGILMLMAPGFFAIFLWGSPETRLWPTLWKTEEYNLALLGLGMLLLISGSMFTAFIRRRNRLLRLLEKAITWRSAEITNGLAPTGHSLDYLYSQFSDYHRGNYSREIIYALEGASVGQTHLLAYFYYRLHYVNEQTVSYTESDGKGGRKRKTRKLYYDYYRYSLVIDFPWIKSLAVRASSHAMVDFPQIFEPTSSDFNRAFTLTGSDTLACARFAKPITVLTLLRLKEKLAELNLEFSAEGLLCISFDNENLLEPQMPYDFSTPEDFFKVIDAGVRLPKLVDVLTIVHELAEQHDDNFTPPSSSADFQEIEQWT